MSKHMKAFADATAIANKFNKEREYWLTQLAGSPPKTSLPTFSPGPVERQAQGEFQSKKFELSGELFSTLMRISNGSDCRLHIILAAGVLVLLHKYTANQDIIIGVPIYHQHVECELVNTVLALRNQIRGNMTFKQLLLSVNQVILEAVENQNYPIEALLYQLNMRASAKDFPLFDIAILLENVHDKRYIQHIHVNTVFIFKRVTQSIEGTLRYNPLWYEEKSIETVVCHLLKVLSDGLSDVNKPIVSIDILSKGEKYQLLYDFNQTSAGYPGGKTIHGLFVEQVNRTPDLTALIGMINPKSGSPAGHLLGNPKQIQMTEIQNSKQEGTGGLAPLPDHISITYRELNKKSRQLARILIEKGVKPNTIVGIMVERSLETIIGILGILKSGGAYMPINPDYPSHRVKYMLEDSQAPVLLTKTCDIENHSFTALQHRQIPGFKPYLTVTPFPIRDFDALPFPDRSLVDYEKYHHYIGQAMVKNSISLQCSRGCPYSCAYCHKIWPKIHIVRSAENMFAEIQLFYNMGIKRFVIIDDIFNLDKINSTRFFKLIIRNGLKLQLFFPNGLRGDLLTKEYIDLMVTAGTVSLALALETASSRLQKLVGKNLNLEKLHENITYFCEKYPHVILELFTMHGFPTETEEEALLTLDFIKSLKWVHFPYVHILKIYPNTDMMKLAVKNGIPEAAIAASANLAYHELPETLPFDKRFTIKYQGDFLNNYFLSKERLLHVLPYQLKVLTRDEIVQKYDSYLPLDLNNFENLLEFIGITEEELNVEGYLAEDFVSVRDLNKKLGDYFTGSGAEAEPSANGSTLRILLLDLSQYFSAESRMLYDVVEPPLGLMYIMTYLKKQWGEKMTGKIAKSGIDFDDYAELKLLLEEFQPNIIGIRTLTFYKDFFHRTVAMIRHWGYVTPVIAGGPYATSDYAAILQDSNVDLVVLGEGERTFSRLIREIVANNGRLPGETVLNKIPGIAYIPEKVRLGNPFGTSREIIFMDALDLKRAPGVIVKPEPVNKPGDLSYIIYTSGTTGKPKGVIIEHRNVVRLLFNDKFSFDFDSSDVWTLFHSYCFDFSVWEMYGALLYGGKLIVIPQITARDPGEFLQVLKKEKATVLNQTPSAFYNLIAEEIKFPAADLNIRYIIFGGEALKPARLKEWKARYPRTKLVNMYGITETTVHVTYKEIGHEEIELNISNIGKPIPTLTTYVMDNDQKLLPRGVIGELCVGGEGVGRGYLDRVELASVKFVENPFKSGEKIYKSGDLVRLKENGEMEYRGRIDQQVKIRGFRIELGEIETQLLACAGIKEAVVIDRQHDKEKTEPGEHHNSYLCAYFVPASEAELTSHQLKEYLGKKLPEYMIPLYFVSIERIPVTSNGKLDRSALPAPGLETWEEYAAPQDEVQEKLVKIWSEVLNKDMGDESSGEISIGINDSFFDLGGDSIKVIKLLSLINSAMGTNLKIVDLYNHETIKKLSGIIHQNNAAVRCKELKEAARELEVLKSRILVESKLPREVEKIEDIYPMSDIQKGMVFHSLKNPGQAVYHDQMFHQVVYRAFDPGRFKKALALMVDKHSILRTSFNIDDFGEHVQIVYKQISINMEHEDISGMDRHRQEEYLNEFLERDRQNPLNTAVPPLWRMRTFALDKKNIVMIWIFHHAILDGWSDASFKTELNNIYQELKSNPSFIPPKLKSTYKEFIIEQIFEKQKKPTAAYWKNELKGYKRLEFLPVGQDKGEGKELKKVYFEDLGRPLFYRLTDIARDYHTTVKNLGFASYMYMLYMVSHESDIVAGLVTHNRPVCEDGEKILGCFLNTIPVRIKIPNQIMWRDYIGLINQKLLELTRYERVSLFEILRIIDEETADHNPLFDTFFIFVDFHVYHQLNWDEEQQTGQDENSKKLSLRGNTNSNTLLDFSLETNSSGFFLTLSYAGWLLHREEAEKLVRYFKAVLDKFIHEPRELAGKDRLISLQEKEELLYRFNNTGTGYPRDKTLHELFADEVEEIPDQIALIGKNPKSEIRNLKQEVPFGTINAFGLMHLTYKELNEKSDQLAYLLQEKGVGPDIIVAIMMERSIDMIIGILAILKAGGAYLPLEPNSPAKRMKYMLNDSSANVLVTTDSLSGDRNIGSCEEWNNIEKVLLNSSSLPNCPASFFSRFPTPHFSNLVYAIYTSGSSGKPKGVLINHQSLVNFITGITNIISFTGRDRVLSLTTICFDIFGLETLLPLTRGSQVVIGGREEQLSAEACVLAIEEKDVTILQLTPSRLSLFLSVDHFSRVLKLLRYLLVGGEALPVRVLEKTRRAAAGKIYNMYGPTETTIWSTVKDVSKREDLNIGTPIANTQIYILGLGKTLQPVGIPGELYIGGEGLARGYLNKPGLTAEKFIEQVAGASTYGNRYSWEENKQKFLRGSSKWFFQKKSPGRWKHKIYKTGDLARWLPDGNIEFLGRLDYQVKVRGFRIELGEIENQLKKYDKVKETIVLAKEDKDGEKYLCAYIVASGEFSIFEVRKYLYNELPGYMVPSYFVILDQIPLTLNGKIDRKVLLETELEFEVESYSAPRDRIEKKLLEIWSKVLAIEKDIIGIDANFFHLGGHSLKANALMVNINREFNVNIPLSKMFKVPTVKGLAEYIKNIKGDQYTDIEPVERKEYVELSFAQKRLFILDQVEENIKTAYNLPIVMAIEGNFDQQRFEDAVQSLVRRHESLRTSFALNAKKAVQVIHNNIDFNIEYHEPHYTSIEHRVQGKEEALWPKPFASIINNFIRPFDLSQAPLFRVGLIKLGNPEHLLLFDMHHIISDGISMGVLVKDFVCLYEGKELQELDIQYKDFSQWQLKMFTTEKMKKKADYWLGRFKDDIPVLNLPTDYPRPQVKCFSGDTVSFKIEMELTGKIKKIAAKTGTTLYILLLAAYNILLFKYTEQEDIIVGTPIAGRNHQKLENIIGMFVNTLAMRNQPRRNRIFKEFLQEVKENAINAYENQDYPFEELVNKLTLQKIPARNPLFDTLFVSENLDIPKLKVKGVKFTPYEFENKMSHLDLVFYITESNKGISLKLEYSSSLFKRATARRMLNHYFNILEQIVENKEIILDEITISHNLLIPQETVHNKAVDFNF